MTREVRWERMFPDQLEAAFEEQPVVYFTYGLCEPHGPQNALGLDGLKARAIAIETAQTFGGIVAPADYWHIHELGGYAIWAESHVGETERKWLTAVPPWVHFKNVCYQIRAAEEIGFHAAILLTGHYGPNWEDLKTLVDLIQPFVRVRLYALPDWEANVPGFDYDGRSGGDHAGKVETSLLWSLMPECVDMSRIPPSASGKGEPDPEAPYWLRPPYFAMGPNALESSREAGDRMVADEVLWLGRKAEELLVSFDPDLDVPGLSTYESVERFWDSRVRPSFREFKTMSRDFGKGDSVSPDSAWFGNWEVPDRS